MCISKHLHSKLDWKHTIQLLFLSHRMLPSISSFPFILSGRDHLTPLHKLFLPYARYLEDKKKSPQPGSYQICPCIGKENICINRLRSDFYQAHKVIRSQDKFSIGNIVYVKRQSPPTQDFNWEYMSHKCPRHTTG